MLRVTLLMIFAIFFCGYFSEISAKRKVPDNVKKQMYNVAQNGQYNQVYVVRGAYLRRIPTYCWHQGQWVPGGDSWQNIGKSPSAKRTFYLSDNPRFVASQGRTMDCYLVKSKNSGGGKKKGQKKAQPKGQKKAQPKGQKKATKPKQG